MIKTTSAGGVHFPLQLNDTCCSMSKFHHFWSSVAISFIYFKIKHAYNIVGAKWSLHMSSSINCVDIIIHGVQQNLFHICGEHNLSMATLPSSSAFLLLSSLFVHNFFIRCKNFKYQNHSSGNYLQIVFNDLFQFDDG